MIILDMEASSYYIWEPSINGMKDYHHLFLIDILSQIFITQLFIDEWKGVSFLHEHVSKTHTRCLTFQKSISEINHG
jgi:hypothetical protein